MIVLDACVLIAYLEGDDAHHERALALLEREIGEGFALGTLTAAEVLVAPARVGKEDVVRGILEDLRITELPLPVGAAARLARLRAATRLKMPDCCVLLAAQEAGARLATFDERLATEAESYGVPVVMGRAATQ